MTPGTPRRYYGDLDNLRGGQTDIGHDFLSTYLLHTLGEMAGLFKGLTSIGSRGNRCVQRVCIRPSILSTSYRELPIVYGRTDRTPEMVKVAPVRLNANLSTVVICARSLLSPAGRRFPGHVKTASTV